MPARTRVNFHGDPARFPVLVSLIVERFGRDVRYIADVAGGRGMLTSLLRKKNYDAVVIDPRGWRLRRVPGVEAAFDPRDASYYDLVVGLHPDQATQAVALSALVTRTVLVPCCNFWDRSQRLGTRSLVDAIEGFYRSHGVGVERVTIPLDTPKNVALVTTPPARRVDLTAVTLPSLEPAPGQTGGREGWLARKKAEARKAREEA
jgi:hypothetical protein